MSSLSAAVAGARVTRAARVAIAEVDAAARRARAVTGSTLDLDRIRRAAARELDVEAGR